MIQRLTWYFWQLFPCTYRTTYKDDKGHEHFSVWKMWLGRSYSVIDVDLSTCILD
jgi:hypothetical protein